MKKVLLIAMVICLVASSAMATKVPSKIAPANMQNSHGANKSLTEGFEGSVPPAGWGSTVTNGAFTWNQGISAYEGSYAANIEYDPALSPQNETLTVSYSVASGDDLTFWTMGSAYWAANAPFTVEVDGAVVYDYSLENNGSSWVWEEVTIDLEAWAGSTVTLTFRYAGVDGAQQVVDAVNIGEYTPPPPVYVDFCADVEDVYGTVFTGTTCGGQNLISSLPCGNYSEAGLEYYYEIEMPINGSFTATVTNTADGGLWVVDDCIAQDGDFNCLAYADDTFSGDPEVIMYTNTTGVKISVYLVIDSYGSDSCGDYTFEFDGTGGAVAVESAAFGDVKSMYR